MRNTLSELVNGIVSLRTATAKYKGETPAMQSKPFLIILLAGAVLLSTLIEGRNQISTADTVQPQSAPPTRATEAARPSAPPTNPPSAPEWGHATYKAERFANGNGGDFKDGLVKEALIFDSGWALRPPRDTYQSIMRGETEDCVVVDDPSPSKLPTRWEGEWIGDKYIRNNTDYDSVEVALKLLADKTAELSKVYLKQANELIAPGAVVNSNKEVKKEFWKGTWSASGSELNLHFVKE